MNSLDWLLLRDSHQDWLFDLATVPEAIGFPVLLAALLALWLVRAEASWRETLLLCWIVVPIVCLQLLPVKGFHDCLPSPRHSPCWRAARSAAGGRPSGRRIEEGGSISLAGLFVAAVVARVCSSPRGNGPAPRRTSDHARFGARSGAGSRAALPNRPA